ncbi:MAG: biotin--[acetyl-CoA-carboxylase] ligase [Gammaproteobacteria bacterium]|nr:biotin--[acetyl-CoA-carboxylase] ligase [Gammaproteobacteria bacterium]
MKAKTWKACLIALSDGNWHSGEVLGRALGLTRAAVWQRIEALRSLGVPVDSGPLGYRIPDGVYVPQSAQLTHAACPIVVTEITESTNQDVLTQPGSWGEVALWQTAGRGRRGRSWWGAPGRTLMCSVGTDLESQGQAWWGLSLAVGVVVAESLEALGVSVQLKWPNDLYLNQQKLGGLLIELSGDPLGHVRVVAGLGLNLASVRFAETPPMAVLREFGCVWSDAATAVLMGNMWRCIAEFSDQGFERYHARYESRCLLTGRAVVVEGAHPVQGVCRGVDSQGQLIVETEQGLHGISAGEVSVRWQ